MPIFLNALAGRGVHIITVNDYLAQRDSEWMGEVYKRLGLTVGFILNSMDNEKEGRCIVGILYMEQIMNLVLII